MTKLENFGANNDTMTRALSTADIKILALLQRAGRLTNVELAERVGMAPSPCLRRLRQLEADGVITGYTAQVNRHALGYGVEALVMVTLDQRAAQGVEALKQAIVALDQVVTCYAVTGEFDLMLRVVATDLEAYGDFTMNHLLTLPGVKDVRSSFVIGTVKDAVIVPLPATD